MKTKLIRRLVTLLVAVAVISGSITTAFAGDAVAAQPGLTVQQMLQTPDSPATKGEFARLVNTYLGLTGQGAGSFQDVPADYPYAADLAIAKDTGYFAGDGSGNVNPEKVISGAEAVMAVNFFLTSKLGFDLSKINADGTLNVPDWAKPAASNLIDLTMVSKELAEKPQLTMGDANKFASAAAVALMFPGSPYMLSQASQNNDYYAYINRRFLATAAVSPGQVAVSTGGVVAEQTNAQLNGIVSAVTAQNDLAAGSDEWKINEIYNMYMDNDARTKSLEKLAPIFNDIRAAKTVADLDAISLKYADVFPLQMFYQIGPLNDAKNDALKWAAIVLPNSSYGLSADYYADNDQMAPVQKARKEFFAALLKFAGETENLDKRAEAVYNIEKSAVQKRKSVNVVSDLAVLYTPTAWADINPIISHGAALSAEWKAAMEKLPVYCPDIEYIRFISGLYTEGNLAALKDNAIIMVLSTAGAFLGDGFLDLQNGMTAALFGSAPAKQPIETRAMATVATFLTPVLSNMYAAKYGTQAVKDDVTKMVEAIREQRIEKVNELDWMSAETKAKAIDKLKSIKVYAGYSDTPLEELNYNVTARADGGNLIDLYIGYSKAANAKALADLQKPVDQNEWKSSPSYTVDAHYNPFSNSILIPIGILQAPFYVPGGTREENLGAIGAVIAHEFTHSVDNNGAKYDKNGTLTDWWTADDYAAFSAKTKAVSDKLSEITFDGQQVNGELIVSEAIADLGGLSAALGIAAKEKLDAKAVFNAWANVWATRMSKEVTQYLMSYETHPSPKIRVNFTSAQQDAFYEAFNIQPGDGMYTAPEDRVNVW